VHQFTKGLLLTAKLKSVAPKSSHITQSQRPWVMCVNTTHYGPKAAVHICFVIWSAEMHMFHKSSFVTEGY